MRSCASWRRICAALWMALCVSVAASSAAQTVGGTLLGTVVDNSGAVLPGATVTATNTATGVARTAISDGQGRYSIADLPPGAYNVNSSLSGFQTVLRRGIRLVVGNPSVVDFTLGISGVAETVTVSGAAPVVDTVSTALGTVVEQKQMAELPLVDRSYSRLIVLAPGANEVPPATAGGQFQQFFGRQPQYTVSGARPEGQVFLLGQHQRAELLEPRQRIRSARHDARRRGDRRVPGADQHLQRAVRRQRRRDQRDHQVGHESVSRHRSSSTSATTRSTRRTTSINCWAGRIRRSGRISSAGATADHLSRTRRSTSSTTRGFARRRARRR